MGVTLHGYLRCADAAEATRVRDALQEHIRLTRAEVGCVSFDVNPTADPLVLEVSEAFSDAAAIKLHNERASTSAWAMTTEGITRDYQITGML